MISSTDDDYWQSLQSLLSSARLIVDRPRGQAHPRYPDLIYPRDYGYLEGTVAGDGAGIDVWIGTSGAKKLTGILCTFDTVKLDAEVKLLADCNAQDLQAILQFNQKFVRYVYIPRPQDTLK